MLNLVAARHLLRSTSTMPRMAIAKKLALGCSNKHEISWKMISDTFVVLFEVFPEEGEHSPVGVIEVHDP